jgi:hypothetical protein
MKIAKRGEFEIVLSGGTQQVMLCQDPAIERELKRVLHVSTGYAVTQFGTQRSGLFCGPHFVISGPLPVCIAFDVLCRIDGTEYLIGTLYGVSGADEPDFDYNAPLEEFDATEGMIVLRPTAAIADNKVDCPEIWGKEIALGPLRLGRVIDEE